MIADIFIKDYRQMTSKGVTFTPEDIVRLNALALKVKLAQRPFGPVSLPRVCFLDEKITFREPTIAHEMWIEQAAKYIDIRDARNFYLVHGFALSHLDPSKLPDAFKPKKVIRKVFLFAAKKLVKFTQTQIEDAIDYCLYGADWTACEHGPTTGTTSAAPDTGRDKPSPALGLMARSRARRLPISLEEAKRMTASELIETIARAEANDGLFSAKEERHAAMGEYVRARDEIVRRRTTEAKADGQASGPETQGGGSR